MHDADHDFVSLTDNQLMESVRDGRCIRSFETLVERWREPIVKLCCRMIFSWDDAEDLTQDVFARLFQSRERYLSSAKFSTFLWKIAINRCRDFQRSALRAERRQQHIIDSRVRELQSEASQSAERGDDALDHVRTALSQLEPIYREVLVLRHFEDLKYHQIADVLEVPFGTVASRMSKALKLMSQQLSADATTQ